jgi:hypothetical protein
MNLFRINTTAYEEEDFLLVTDLTESQIKKVIKPLVRAEREDGDFYDNETLVAELVSRYPKHTIIHYQIDGAEKIEF